jgi:hypothetical protein
MRHRGAIGQPVDVGSAVRTELAFGPETIRPTPLYAEPIS